MSTEVNQASKSAPLKRSLSLSQLVLYGMGTTIGAGVYALIGEIANTAGYLAPWSFLLAALLAVLTARSFAVLSSRFPRTAGIALYVEKGFGNISLARATGILTIAAGLVSSAALLNGFVGYLQEIVFFPRSFIIPVVVMVIAIIACWGIKESVWVAGAITLIEIGGLVWATALAGRQPSAITIDLSVFAPEEIWFVAPAILSGAILAFYAYIGFEDMVEVAEEVVEPEKNLPRAIFITLGASTLLYIALTTSALLATGPAFLATSTAPLTDLFRALGAPHYAITAIGLLAIINGVLIQIVMAARIFFGLATRKQLPVMFAQVHPTRQTPVRATVVASIIVTVLAWSGTIAGLAEVTSAIILVLFTLVNASLLSVELNSPRPSRSARILLSSALGALICVCLLAFTLLSWIT